MNVHYDRARVLIEQQRPELAERELRQALHAEPNHAGARALLALCLVELERFGEATREAEQSIHQRPDNWFPHYVLARVKFDRNRLPEAETSLSEAIRLDPEKAENFALLATIRLRQKRWAEALEAAEEGLVLDPEDVGCTNLRAMALVKLGRKELGGATIDAALARNPEDALSHANQGWTLLEKGQHVKAMEHFREALRLDPGFEWARQGIVEALKSRNFIYRIMLAYFLWMSKLSDRAQWGILIGGYIGYRMLMNVARNNPNAAPWIWPVLIAYFVFAMMTWLAHPLFDLLLRLNRFGRLALSRDQVVASNWLGGCLLLALVFLIGDALHGVYFSIPALMVSLFSLPLTAVFRCDRGWPRKWMAIYTLGLGCVGLVGLLHFAVLPGGYLWWLPTQVLRVLGPFGLEYGIPALRIYFLAALVSQFVANWLVSVEPKR